MNTKQQRYILDKMSQIREAIWKLQNRFEDRRLYRNTCEWTRGIGCPGGCVYIHPVTVTDVIRVADGTAATPVYSFLDDPTVGMYRVGNNQLGFTAAGAQVAGIYNDAIADQILLVDRDCTNPAYSFLLDRDTGMYRGGDNQVLMAAGGAIVCGFYNDATANQVVNMDGSDANPSYSFLNERDTGIFRVGANELGFAASAGHVASIYGNLATERQIRLVDGNYTRPAYSFLNDTNLGFYRVGVDTIGVAMGNALDFQFSPNTFTGLAGSSMVMDTMTIATGSITDSSGAISFGNENLSTTGTFQTAAIGVGGAPNVTYIGYFYRNDASTTPHVRVEQDSTGDATITCGLSGTQWWTLGVDNSDGDRFKIEPAYGLTNANYFSMDTDGHIGIGNDPYSRTYLRIEGTITDTAAGYGIRLLPTFNPSSAGGDYSGVFVATYLSGSNNVDQFFSGYFSNYFSANSNTVRRYEGFYCLFNATSSTMTVTETATMFQIRAEKPAGNAIAVGGDFHQLWMTDVSGVFSVGGTTYGIKQEGSSYQNYFEGDTFALPNLLSGANQAAAGAAAGEIWHDTTDDTIKMGV